MAICIEGLKSIYDVTLHSSDVLLHHVEELAEPHTPLPLNISLQKRSDCRDETKPYREPH